MSIIDIDDCASASQVAAGRPAGCIIGHYPAGDDSAAALIAEHATGSAAVCSSQMPGFATSCSPLAETPPTNLTAVGRAGGIEAELGTTHVTGQVQRPPD